MRRLVGIGLLAVAHLGCELDEVNLPTTQTLVIVQGVLRTDQRQQWILVERSFNGTSAADQGSLIPGAIPPAVPIQNATVTLTNMSLPADPCGTDVVLTEVAGPPERSSAGVYWAPDRCPTLRPGDTLALEVVAGSDRVTARTVIPNVTAMRLRVGGETVQLPGPPLTFNRDIDTLIAEVDATAGRVLTIEVRERRFDETPDSIIEASTQLFVDSTALRLPGDFLNVFEAEFDEPGEAIPDLFSAGRLYTATLAYADKNFFDFIRSANSPLSGRGFISTVDGGFGFLGSLVADENDLRVVGNRDDAREGDYHMAGTVDGVVVTLDWELYLNRGDSTVVPMSSFVVGDWVFGALTAWTVGTFSGSAVSTFIAQPTGAMQPDGTPEFQHWALRGTLSGAGPTAITVTRDGMPVGSLTATKLGG